MDGSIGGWMIALRMAWIWEQREESKRDCVFRSFRSILPESTAYRFLPAFLRQWSNFDFSCSTAWHTVQNCYSSAVCTQKLRLISLVLVLWFAIILARILLNKICFCAAGIKAVVEILNCKFHFDKDTFWAGRKHIEYWFIHSDFAQKGSTWHDFTCNFWSSQFKNITSVAWEEMEGHEESVRKILCSERKEERSDVSCAREFLRKEKVEEKAGVVSQLLFTFHGDQTLFLRQLCVRVFYCGKFGVSACGNPL